MENVTEVSTVAVLTLPLAVVGIVQLTKLLAKDVFNYKIKGSITVVMAIFIGGVLNAFVDLTSTLALGAFVGANAVGFTTVVQKLGSVVKFNDPGDEDADVLEPPEPPVDEKSAI